jgi:uncharacterized protein with PIN domain
MRKGDRQYEQPPSFGGQLCGSSGRYRWKPKSSCQPGFDDLFREAQLVVEPVSEAQARIAREAYRDFGKGTGHRAGLNFGDCFAYALAKEQGEAILFRGVRHYGKP